MDPCDQSDASRELLLDAAIAEYLQMQDRGYQVDRQAFMAQHAELADELADFFQGIPAIESVAGESEASEVNGEQEDTSDTRYSVSSLHASGGIGRIYVAQDRDLRRKVALKSIHPRLHHHPVIQARFLREAQVTGQLEHPNIVPVYELVRGTDGAVRFYTMRFVRGKTLRAEIREYFAGAPVLDRIAFRRLVAAFLNICYAVEYAHSRSIVHRDLKPDNVMIGKFGEVALMDWGLAKHVTTEDLNSSAVHLSAITSAEVSTPSFEPGTPAYMAPEQAKAQSYLVGLRTDVYGLGAILFEILTGQVPHIQRGDRPLREQIAEDASPDPVVRRPDSPRALAAICRKAMAYDAGDRYATAKLLGEDVERWLADEPVSIYREPLLKRASRWVRRHRVVAGTLAGLATAASIAAATWWTVELAKDGRAIEETSLLLGSADAAYRAGTLDEAARGYSNAVIAAKDRGRLRHLQERASIQLGLVEGELRTRHEFAAFQQFVHDRLNAAEADMMLGDSKAAVDSCRQILERYQTENWDSRLQSPVLLQQATTEVRQQLVEAIFLSVAAVASSAPKSSPESLEKSLELLSRADKICPESRGVQLLRGKYLEALDRTVEAKAVQRQARDLPPQTAFDFFLQGEIDRRNRQHSLAIEHYERALQLKPDDFWSHVRLANCWMRVGDPQRAIGYFDHALRLAPDSAWLRAARAVALADLQLWDQALADLAEADRLDPDFYGTTNNRGVVIVRQALNSVSSTEDKTDLLQNAILEFHRSLQQRPSYAGAWVNIGRVCQQLGEMELVESRAEAADAHFAAATQAFSAALEIEPNSITSLTHRGLAKLSLDDVPGALFDVELARQIDSRDPEVYRALGQISFVQGAQSARNNPELSESHFREAIAQFENAIRLAPQDAAGLLGRARARFELLQAAVQMDSSTSSELARKVLDDLAKAERYGGQMLPAKERAQLLGMRATSRAEVGDHGNSLADYALALTLDPNDELWRVRRGWAIITATSDSMADFDQAIAAADPADPRILADAHVGRAYLLAVAGDDRAAADAAEHAVALAPQHWPTLFNAACSYSLASETAREENADEASGEKYAVRAIELLRQATAHGLGTTSTITEERSLVPLRQRADFTALVDGLKQRSDASDGESAER